MAILCGVNLLLLIFGYMPAKYLFDAVETNKWLISIPIAHGYLYIVYILTALQIGVQKKMSLPTILALIAAGIHRDGAKSLLKVIYRQLELSQKVREPKPQPITKR